MCYRFCIVSSMWLSVLVVLHCIIYALKSSGTIEFGDCGWGDGRETCGKRVAILLFTIIRYSCIETQGWIQSLKTIYCITLLVSSSLSFMVSGILDISISRRKSHWLLQMLQKEKKSHPSSMWIQGKNHCHSSLLEFFPYIYT